MYKRKRLVSAFLAATLLLTLFGAMPISAEAEREWFRSIPSSAVFDSLWVGDIICFDSQFYDLNFDQSQPEPGNTTTIISGDCVEIVDICLGPGEMNRALRFTKPGNAQVKIKETNPETGESREKTFSFTVTQRPADQPVTATYNHSLGNGKVKIGEKPEDTVWKDFLGTGPDPEEMIAVKFHNANYGPIDYSGPGKIDLDVKSLWFFGGGRGGASYPLVRDDRIAGPQIDAYFGLETLGESYAFKPGIKSLDLSYGDSGKLGDIGTITVEEPVITTNAPVSVKVGSTLNLTTALTNTALKNLETAEYEDENNYTEYGYYEFEERGNNPIAYKPSVTVIAGMDCITQSEQDYSNTLTSSETLTFKKTGTVKLKVTYTQFATDPEMLYDYDWDVEKEELVSRDNDKRYHPEKIITIQVTEDGLPLPQPLLFGDINGDEVVNTTDARMALQYAVEKLTFNEEQLTAGDVDGNGIVNTTDARLILQYAVEKIDKFPAEQ